MGPVDCASGLLAEPLSFGDCLVSPELCTRWCTGVWRPTGAIASSVGDEFYTTRSKPACVFVDHDGDPDRSLDKGCKIYGLGAPTTTLTSPNNFHFVDDRRSSDPLHVGVRQLEVSEVLKISGFDDDLNATAFPKSRSKDGALKTVASAIPPPTLHHLYRAIVHHAIGVRLSPLRAASSLEETFVIDLHPDRDLPPCDDDDFALFAAGMVSQAADCPADFEPGEEALPSMLQLGATRNEGLHVSPLKVLLRPIRTLVLCT